MSVDTVAPPRPVTPLTILAAKLERLCDQAATGGFPLAFTAELEQARDLAAGLDPYLESCTTPESPALRELARRTDAADWVGARIDGGPLLEREMLSGHVEGQALAFLIHLARARRVLEIGMFTGYSALAMAEALPEGGTVVACEIDADVADFARRCFAASRHGHRVDVRVGPARQTLERLAAAGDKFDLVFLDADKGGYGDYVDALLDTDLLAAGGVICVDNTLLQGEPYLAGERSANGAAVAAFNAKVAADDRLVQVLLPLRDGLTLIRRA